VIGHLSARSRLTLLYTSLFVVCGAVLVSVTYLLLANNLRNTNTTSTPQIVQKQIGQCLLNATTKGAPSNDAKAKCAALYASGVKAGASAQRSLTLEHLLLYSALTLAAVTILAAIAGWIVAGRILRPVQQLTAAARAASGHNLCQRLALQGPRDELRELGDTFDSMLERLENAFASQRQFIANASHELRTPLTVMRTAIDVVLAKPHPTLTELVSMSAEVRRAVDQADGLIDALLTLARNEQVRRVAEPVDLSAVVEDVLDGRAEPGTTIRCTLDNAPVTGDGVLLERLVANLLDNALQYNVPSGIVAISTGTEIRASILRVVNTGSVVPLDQVERLFLPFTRLDDRTRHHGFGLGLALVSSITTVHGGTVTAAAIPTGGLDVTVRIPRRSE
jgi:signal transduction histidine kinase